MKNTLRYISVILIWGSTWLAIKFQLDVVDPMVTIFYRFIAACALIFIFCIFTKRSLKFSFHSHLMMGFQGICTFALNYWLFYQAQKIITSGLAAVIFSLLVFMNIINAYLFMQTPFKKSVFIGAVLGFIGILLIFQPEFIKVNISAQIWLRIGFGILGTYIFSIGNIISAYNQKNNLPVIPSTAFSMLYGALFMLILALLSQKPIILDTSISYLGGLSYTIIFGSVIAFLCYLTLIGELGAGRTAYIMLITPLVAMILSTFFEEYKWTIQGMLGMLMILSGKFLVLQLSNTSKRKIKQGNSGESVSIQKN